MDPNGLLTILGIAVAVFAIIPRESRLDISLRISRVDLILVFLSLFLVHYIVYFPVLNELGLALDLGHWKWGFNEKNTTYLILLFLAIYIFLRARVAKVTRSNIRGFNDLFECLLFEGKYGELAFLTEKHLRDIINIQKNYCLRNKVALMLRPSNKFARFMNDGVIKDGFLKKRFPNQMKGLAIFFERNDIQKTFASSIIIRIFNNPEYVSYLSISKPYLCIEILNYDIINKEDFLKLFINSLLDKPGGTYYFELEHTQNNLSHNRYVLYKSNKLLFYFFNDVKVSEKLAVYKPVGDKVCEIIDDDSNIEKRYNEPLGNYEENQRFRCPIYSSLHFFNIMIIESMHQGIRWHMWLFYFQTFTKKIIDKLIPDDSVDLQAEWPTPFHYLLYSMVKIILGWIDESQYVANKEFLLMNNDSLNHDNGSIPKSAALAIGNIVFMIISSNKIDDSFKIEIIEIIMRDLRNSQSIEDLNKLNCVLMKSILFNGFYNKVDLHYLYEFKRLYSKIDHVIRFDLDNFNELLENSIAEIDGLNKK